MIRLIRALLRGPFKKPDSWSVWILHHLQVNINVFVILYNVFKQKTVFSKVIVIWCYKMVFSGFGKFHQKEFPALLPLFKLLLPVRQLTQLVLCARAFEEPLKTEEKQDQFWPISGFTRLSLISPLTNFESARGESILPTVLIVLRVENPVFVFFWSDVLLPLFLTVAVFTTQPTVIARLFYTDNKLHQFINPSNSVQASGWIQATQRQTHHFLCVVCRHVDLFAVLPNGVIGHFITPTMLLRLQPSLIKLIHIWN